MLLCPPFPSRSAEHSLSAHSVPEPPCEDHPLQWFVTEKGRLALSPIDFVLLHGAQCVTEYVRTACSVTMYSSFSYLELDLYLDGCDRNEF